jgi:ABC-type enterobactin transport system permease subunit
MISAIHRFVISKLEVTKRRHHDIWASGDIKQIEWTSSNDIDTVGILYHFGRQEVYESSFSKQ